MFRSYAMRIYSFLDTVNDWVHASWFGPYFTAAAILWLLPIPAFIEFFVAVGIFAALFVANPTFTLLGRRGDDDG